MADLRVLLVEDEVDGQEVVATILEMQGIAVDVVGDGQSALTVLEEQTYDVAIIDIALPDIDGWQVFEHIQSQDHLTNLYCIAITAYHDSSVRQKANESGFDDYLPKPISGDHLIRALNKFS